MAKKKLNWSDVEDISFRLIDEYPDMNPMRLSSQELKAKVLKLPDFGGDPKKANEELLEAIQTSWFEERSEMEDELGPLDDSPSDDLDEDDYRDDKMIDEVDVLVDDEEDDDEESELGEGFQEEEIDERA